MAIAKPKVSAYLVRNSRKAWERCMPFKYYIAIIITKKKIMEEKKRISLIKLRNENLQKKVEENSNNSSYEIRNSKF